MGTWWLPPAWELYLKDHCISIFKNWPFLEDCACISEQMAAAGFIHCPTENKPDLAQCFFCFKELEGWETKSQRKPTINRNNLKKLQRKSPVPLRSWLPWRKENINILKFEYLNCIFHFFFLKLVPGATSVI
uniref:Baculoviral IAP repeat-containing protein 5 n=1 Tax=Moschus moschiferus TaxID=68415 RepID=A0A8C6E090_MOSMO